MDEAEKCRRNRRKENHYIRISGTGYFDMTAYMSYNDGTMTDYIPTDEDLEKGFDCSHPDTVTVQVR
jgi:tryptophan synthase beta chain